MKSPLRGAVYLVDLGLAAKVRPCLVLSVPLDESDRSLVTVIPHTTAVRQSRFEIVVPARFLRPGAFDAQGIVTVPTVRLMNQLGTLTTEQLGSVESGVWRVYMARDQDRGITAAMPAREARSRARTRVRGLASWCGLKRSLRVRAFSHRTQRKSKNPPIEQ